MKASTACSCEDTHLRINTVIMSDVSLPLSVSRDLRQLHVTKRFAC